jgi:acylphosphatase
METKRLVVSGIVQGVGYRHFVLGVALRLDMAGYARNLSDGTVEVVVQLEEEARLQALVDELKKGPPSSRVVDVEIHTLTGFSEDLSGFAVRL